MASASQTYEQPNALNSSYGRVTQPQAVASNSTPATKPTYTTASGWNIVKMEGIPLEEPAVPSNTHSAVRVPSPKTATNTAPRAQVAPSAHPTNAQSASTNNTPALDPLKQHEADELTRRHAMAEQISKQLLSDKTKKVSTAKPLHEPRGWKAVEDDLRLHLRNCHDLLRRGAVHSAQEEIIVAARTLCQELDCRGGDWYSEPCFDRAMIAFEEHNDFYKGQSVAASCETLIGGHQTPVFRNQSAVNVAPSVAAQHYRAYAREELIAASQGCEWFADLYYALGKTYESLGDSNTDHAVMYREQAIACYQAALAIERNHSDAANQLGYSLLRVDRIREAEQVLVTAIAVAPTPQSWKNLAEVYRRSGQTSRAEQAVQQAVALEGDRPRMVTGKAMPEVVQVPPEQFAQMSPNVISSGSFLDAQLENSPSIVEGSVGPSQPAAQASTAKASKFESIKQIFR